MLDHRPAPPPQGAIGALLRCSCGHGIGAHTADGCGSDGFAPCRCRRSRAAIRDRAIDEVIRDLHG